MKKLVIIGAGPAGLTAAYEMLKRSNKYQVIVLEEDKDVGGISKTVDYFGNKMDLGGHRFFTKNKDVMKIWEELLPLDNIDKEKILLKRKRVSRILYKNKFFDYPISLSFNTIKNLGVKDTIISGFSYIKSCIHKLPEDNLENFYINRFGRKLYQEFFMDYTEKLWGVNPKYIDSSWGSQRVKGISIRKVIKDFFERKLKLKSKDKEVSLIEEFYYPKYGPGQMYTEMKNKIINRGGIVKLNCKVVKINKKGRIIDSLIYEENGKREKIELDYLISTMPIKDLVSSLNNYNKKIKNIALNLPYRDFITIGFVVDKLKIKDKKNNFMPDTWIYVQQKDVKLGRIQVFNNWSPFLVKKQNTISLGLEYFCTESDDFWNKSNDELKQYAYDELLKINFIDNDTKIICYHVEKVKKAYPAYFGSYNKFDEIKKYLNNIENLYCIGRNGMHRYNNMDHSMETAIVCVNNILNDKLEKENIWNVNTENEYLESEKSK